MIHRSRDANREQSRLQHQLHGLRVNLQAADLQRPGVAKGKTFRQGTLEVEVEWATSELVERERTFPADKELDFKLTGRCTIQVSEWQERQRLTAEELVAVHDTIKC